MSYFEEDFADMLFAWPAVEGRIIHLYELDPTHAVAQPSAAASGSRAAAVQGARSSLPFCVLDDAASVSMLLELDPTHLHAA